MLEQDLDYQQRAIALHFASTPVLGEIAKLRQPMSLSAGNYKLNSQDTSQI